MMLESMQSLPGAEVPGREVMQTPEEVAAIMQLRQRGWGIKAIARQLGCSRNTVRRYLHQGGWQPYGQPARSTALAGLEQWVAERFAQHRGNADVVRQELAAEHGVAVSLRTVQRAVKGLGAAPRAEAVATVRFETAPGAQMQIDFGTIGVSIDGAVERVHLFVATLGYSRRIYVDAFLHERQSAWFGGIEGAFRHFGGVPAEVLLDNARALVMHHDAATREVRFNPRLHAFCRYWGVRPRACAPFRARTKGKDERGVGYVKHNAIAGRRFASFEALRAHLAHWMREVADTRVHGTTGEAPAVRFERDERTRLAAIEARAPFAQLRELVRRVHTDACVEIDTCRYSVPWRLIGEAVTITVSEAAVRVTHAGVEVARHAQLSGRRTASIDRAHLIGVVGAQPFAAPVDVAAAPLAPAAAAALLRPLAEYEHAAGGAW